MERLTQKSDKMIWLKDQGLKIEPCEMNAHHCRMILEKLVDYEDLEEQGLLVRLPCKVGDTVYVPTRNFVSELRITLVSVDTNDMAMYFSWLLNSGIYPNLDGFSGYELGKTVFLTREEAEKKLEEIQNDKT